MESIPLCDQSLQTYSSDAAHDFGPTDRELRFLVAYVYRRAHTIYGATPIPVAEYEDAGVNGLIKAWLSWDGSVGVPFWRYGRDLICKHMRHAHRDYLTWQQPGGQHTTQRWKVRAEHLRPEAATVSADDIDLAWLRTELPRHPACLPPHLTQALHDFLDDRPYEQICARDGCHYPRAKQRRTDMLATLRRHLGTPGTSCAAEQARWRSTYRPAKVASLAAAD